MACLSVAAIVAFLAVLVNSADASPLCTSFSVNGSYAASFSYYRFYDFRNVDGPVTVQSDGPSTPSIDPIISKTVNGTTWTRDWSIRKQAKRPPNDDLLALHYVTKNVLLNSSLDRTNPSQTTYLTLLTARLANETQESAEIDYTETNITFLSLRLLARVNGAPGAVAGFFTYHNDTSESDIEILMRDPPNRAHFSNQPTENATGGPVSGASFNASLSPGKDVRRWNTYRLDWLPLRSVWYINGAQVAETAINVPRAESMVIVNMWSNGGPFSGRMRVGESATLDVGWIEMAYNKSGSTNPNADGMACSIDRAVGSPVPSSGMRRIGCDFVWTLVIQIVVAGTLWL